MNDVSAEMHQENLSRLAEARSLGELESVLKELPYLEMDPQGKSLIETLRGRLAATGARNPS